MTDGNTSQSLLSPDLVHVPGGPALAGPPLEVTALHVTSLDPRSLLTKSYLVVVRSPERARHQAVVLPGGCLRPGERGHVGREVGGWGGREADHLEIEVRIRLRHDKNQIDQNRDLGLEVPLGVNDLSPEEDTDHHQ